MNTKIVSDRKCSTSLLQIMKNLLKRTCTLSALGITSYLAGIYSERRKHTSDNSVSDLSFLERLPAFPLVGTVSAAVPIPQEKVIDDVPKIGDSVAVRSAQVT